MVLRSHEAYKRRSQGHVDGWVSGISIIKHKDLKGYHEKKTAITNIKKLMLLDNVYLARIRIILMIDHFRALLGFVSRNQAEDYLKVITVKKRHLDTDRATDGKGGWRVGRDLFQSCIL